MTKKYLFGAFIVIWTLLFFAIAPGWISGYGGDFYLGVLFIIAYPLSMYYLIKYFIKLIKNEKVN